MVRVTQRHPQCHRLIVQIRLTTSKGSIVTVVETWPPFSVEKSPNFSTKVCLVRRWECPRCIFINIFSMRKTIVHRRPCGVHCVIIYSAVSIQYLHCDGQSHRRPDGQTYIHRAIEYTALKHWQNINVKRDINRNVFTS